MRKIVAAVLAITSTVVLFTACGKDDNKETTINPLYTAYSYSATAVSQSSAQNVQNQNGAGEAYVLTTNQDKTVPWYETTRFTPGATQAASQGASQQASSGQYDNISYNTNQAVTAPVVNTGQAITFTTTSSPTAAPTNATQNNGTQNNAATVATTTNPNTGVVSAATTKPTTTAPQAQPVDVIVASTWVQDGKYCVSIDSVNWGGKIKTNSQRIPVIIDGVEMEDSVSLQISSSTDGDGFQYVYLKLSDYELSGATVSFTIPEGFLENKTGTKYNVACEVSM